MPQLVVMRTMVFMMRVFSFCGPRPPPRECLHASLEAAPQPKACVQDFLGRRAAPQIRQPSRYEGRRAALPKKHSYCIPVLPIHLAIRCSGRPWGAALWNAMGRRWTTMGCGGMQGDRNGCYGMGVQVNSIGPNGAEVTRVCSPMSLQGTF